MYKMLSYRVSAFTVIEIIVTMIISCIVVFSALEIYKIFNSMYLKKEASLENGEMKLQFFRALENDIDKAQYFNFYTNGLILRDCDNNTIKYEFTSDLVIRSLNSVTDTFTVKLRNFKSIRDRITGYDKILYMDLLDENDTVQLFLEKRYSNDVLVNAIILKPTVKDGY